MHKYHKKTLDKVNDLYKYAYDKMIGATELCDNGDEVLAYINLNDNIKKAYEVFKKEIEQSEK